MEHDALREKLRSEMEQVDAAALLPHHRRGALIIAAEGVDLLEAAVAVATDDTPAVQEHLEAGSLRRSTLGEMADWCVDTSLRLRFVIVQPYVLAQVMTAEANRD